MAVTVEPYNPEWPQHFQQLKARLESFLQGVPYISIEHVGSTSVPNLAAKPIIDTDIIVAPNDVQGVVDALVTRGGFHYLGELGIVHRHVVRDPDQSPPRSTYVCVDGVAQTRNHLGLRDTLRSRPDLRDEYAQVKFDLAAKGTNIVDYIEAKSEIIQKILKASGMLTSEELDALARTNLKGEKWGEIKTERLSLREFTTTANDDEGYYELERNEENARYQTWAPRTREEARELVFANMRNIAAKPRTNWELVVDLEGRMIGRVGAALTSTKGDRAIDHFDLWFSFLPSMQGKGYATEAVTAFVGGLLERYTENDVELEIECDPRNAGSWKLAERLGFEKFRLTERAWECKGEWVGSVVYRKMIERSSGN
jgi:GrpB-like predicted nucleotidyltransferase (UPF0157 family)/RimJ/RimL family protein N-acetyltransferase